MTAEQEALAQRLKLWIDGRSLTSAAPWLGISRPTLRKIMRSQPVAEPTIRRTTSVMDAFTGKEVLRPRHGTRRRRSGREASKPVNPMSPAWGMRRMHDVCDEQTRQSAAAASGGV
jgi:hypothetical protein